VAEVKLTLAGLPSYTRTLRLGFLHPITVASGVQMRLNNLGFACGPANGAQSPGYTAALQAFQRKHLPQNVTGQADNDTLEALRNEYDKGKKS
jgi:peptidoglycan hydrolase-like protein with peptidoglycan-binding domain